MDLSFWKGKNVFLTGHTGFKGSWLCHILIRAGANLTGYALSPPTQPDLFSICGIENNITSVIGDIRDRDKLYSVFREAQPEIVIHMAAQPLVRDSYKDPVYTYETNIIGTVNILECVRHNKCVKSFLNVTTDKVYHNKEWEWGYREIDLLDGFDPYSNSKSCSELVTRCYADSFLTKSKVAVSTARSGNVIGGGDFSKDRIIPDCIRAVTQNQDIIVRNPNSVRPYQHVLDSSFAYLTIVQTQYCNPGVAGCYNIGPFSEDCIATSKLVKLFCNIWGDDAKWSVLPETSAPHESGLLKLDCAKIMSVLGWKPRWDIEKAVQKTIEWTKTYFQKGDVCAVMDEQIAEFIESGGNNYESDSYRC